MGRTLYEKVYDAHVVNELSGELPLLYIDRHLLHEVTSPQAFSGLREAGRKLRRPDLMLATMDHDISTQKATLDVCSPMAREQVTTLIRNCREFGVTLFGLGHPGQGIVHIVGPQTGFTLPGTTLVCGDSHTSTHGACAALAFGIGTSEVEHVLATQTLLTKKNRNMLVRVEGKLGAGITGKDVALAVIGKIGTAGGTGCTIEFAGSAIRSLSMEERMTLCNMAIEAGARSGLVAVDEKTIEYMRGKPLAPTGEDWDKAVSYWKTLVSDADAHFDVVVEMKAEDIRPMVTWGTSPEMVTSIDGVVPDPKDQPDPVKREGWERALKYMDLKPGTKITDIAPDHVFIGSCTNSRIEDLRMAAAVVAKLGRNVAPGVRQALVVPGSGLVRLQAEKEGLDQIFKKAGFEWREPGCSMCLAMNADRLNPGDRCASTSNRNFEGRQGKGGRTHLVSPAMAAAAAVMGHFVDVSKLF